jgi:hypothetical protein
MRRDARQQPRAGHDDQAQLLKKRERSQLLCSTEPGSLVTLPALPEWV